MSSLRFARLLTLVAVPFVPKLALAQVDISIEQGLKPYGSYMGGNLDTVSLSTGNLMLHIPLVSYPQRGGRLNLGFFLRYNNKGFHPRVVPLHSSGTDWVWDGVGVDVARDQVWELRAARSQFSAPTSDGTSQTFFLTLTTMVSPDGSAHLTAAAKSGLDFGGGILDGSNLGLRGILDTTDPNTTYTSSCPGNHSTSWSPLISLDPNGNQITTTSTGWIDTLGRQIPGQPFCISDVVLSNTGGAGTLGGIPASTFSTSFTDNGTTQGFNMRMAPGVSTTDLTSCPANTVSARIWNLPSVNGSTATIKFCYATFQIATNFGVPGVAELNGAFTLLQNVILPNGTMWTFNYNSYGDLTFLGFPTGGSISYSWTTIQLTGGARSRVITSRSVNANDGNGAHAWNYAWTPATPPALIKLVLTDPAGNDSVHMSDSYGYEQQAQYYQGSSANSSNLLKTVQTQYQTFLNPLDEYTGPSTLTEFPTTVTTTLANGQSSRVTSGYDTPTNYSSDDYLCLDCAQQPAVSTHQRINGQLASQSLFDYGNTTIPIRRTATTFFTLDDPSTVITYDGNGNKCAETDYAYDDPNRLVASGITQQHGGPYVNAVRANLSSTTRWLSATPCSATAAWSQITSYSNHNDTGTLASTQDPLGNVASYAYSPTFYGAYITQTTLPTTQNGVAHITSGNYDFNTGLLTSFTDQNGNPSTYTYDNMLRLTSASYPDGGQTTFTYNDTALSVERLQKMTSTASTDFFAYFDGLGRQTQTKLNSDPDCPSGDKTDTTYDVLGRVATVSNPYCTTGDVTYGISSYTYDALGRTTQVTHPDSTTVLTNYTGRATQVQDEGNGTQLVTRISQVDGLGRLASVCEVASGPFVGAGGASSSSLIGQDGTPGSCGQDIAATGFLTSYQYDALGNLTQVNQGTMAPRTFAYDSLSRLTSALNPESGSLTYTYDANGNMLTKTAPAPNQTGSATVTTCFGTWSGTSCDGLGYDALNRPTHKSYSDGTTPTASFLYDSGFSATNAIGRQVQSSVAVPPSVGGCAATRNSYDAMGRVTAQNQLTPVAGCTNSYGFPYTYDLAGNVTSSTAPFQEGYSYTYNAAGRLTSMTGSMSNSHVPANLLTGVHYNAAGQITSETLGTGEVQTYTYDNRNRLTGKSAMLNSTLIYSFGLGLAPNGDVLTVNDSVDGMWAYRYDAFNRLTCANLSPTFTCGQRGTGTPTDTYVYDRFGNRWQQNGQDSFLATFTGNNPGSPANNNRIDGLSYDAAGNLLSDGTRTFTYDAENRIISVANAQGTATYFYDANGRRVHRTGFTNDSCDGTGIRDYIYDLNGNWVVENNSTSTGCNVEIYAGSRHLASIYDGDALFDHTDWLGTSRLRRDFVNGAQQLCTSLPFGDGESCSGGEGSSPLLFTGKERDSESGLDNFGARYYGSSMGRFSRPDPVMFSKQKILDPQQWNMYTYARNNPLRFLDPTGKYLCKGTTDQCKTIKTALENVQKAANNLQEGSKERKALEKVLGFYGKEGDKNGVNVAFGDLKGDEAQTSTSRSFFGLGSKTTTITFDLNQIHHDFSVGGRDEPAETAATAAHEGEHGIDQRINGMPRSRAQEFLGELHAFTTQSYVNFGLEVDSPYGLWSYTQGFDLGNAEIYAGKATQEWCQDNKLCQ